MRRLVALLIGIATLLALVAACGGGKSASPAPTRSPDPPGTQTNLSLTLDGVASAVAVTEHGIYVADTGKGNKFDTQGWGFTSVGGRVLTLEAGVSAQRDITTKVGVPISLATGHDGSIYVASLNPKRVARIAAGATEPVALPFEFGSQILDPSPVKIAVTPTDDVIVLTDKELLLLPKGAQAPKVISTRADKQLLAVDAKGATYFVEKSSHDLVVIDSGTTEARTLVQHDKANPTQRMVAAAFDTNGDRYTITESCGPNQEPGMIRPCSTYVYGVSKNVGGSAVPIDIPVQGLTSATSVAVSSTAIYIADGNRVVKIVK